MTKKESAAMRELRSITDDEAAPMPDDPETIKCPACGEAMTSDMRCSNEKCENFSS